MYFLGYRIGSQTLWFQYRSFYIQQDDSKATQILSFKQPSIPGIETIDFSLNTTVYYGGVVYDFYSIAELGQPGPASQWFTFPLPDEMNTSIPWMPKTAYTKQFSFPPSPKTNSSLAYVDKIYVISDHTLADRSDNIKRMFIRHKIPINSINWRLGRWTRAACTAKSNKAEVYQTLNLQDGPFGKIFWLLLTTISFLHR